MHYEMKGTVLYFAPEIVQKRGYDKSVDLWALGVLAYELVFKQPPFTTNHISSSIYEQKVYDRLRNNKWPANTASKQMKDFINKLLVVSPHKRLGYNSFQEIKDHPLFKSINW
jgi:serine/threonine protein kinase